MDRRLKYMEKETLFYLNYEYGNIYRIENYEDYKDEKNLQSLSRTFYNGFTFFIRTHKNGYDALTIVTIVLI